MREPRFVDLYVANGGNGQQAAEGAGYAPHSARQTAAKLLTKAHIRAEIEKRLRAQSIRTGINADRILQELYRVATCDVGQAFDERGNLLPLREIPEDVRRAISGIETDELWDGAGKDRRQVGVTRKVRFWSKVEALRDLGRHLKLFVDIQEHRGLEGLSEVIREVRDRAHRGA